MSEAPAAISSPNKRAAEDEVPAIVEAKKSKAEVPVEVAPVEADEDDDEDENVDDELEHLDTSNIIEGGRRTRGKKIDYTKVAPIEDDDEDEDDEDAAPVDPVEGESDEEEDEEDDEE